MSIKKRNHHRHTPLQPLPPTNPTIRPKPIIATNPITVPLLTPLPTPLASASPCQINDTSISVFMDRNHEIFSLFNGIKFTWKLVTKHIPSTYIRTPSSNRYESPTLKFEICYYELRFHARHKDMVFTQYLPHVMEKAKEERQQQKPLKLFTLSDQHPIHKRSSCL
ncbi:hypothetical protein PIB30_093768 [Stylosanthes scabra]|uniref:Uncharacterized protein n=1 Tax=Stylosanthes scabra TaxID=79078 RepID=A0ABU6UX14_9FABA|nr:hypothetical protein [Stylosanthes scabra]